MYVCQVFIYSHAAGQASAEAIHASNFFKGSKMPRQLSGNKGGDSSLLLATIDKGGSSSSSGSSSSITENQSPISAIASATIPAPTVGGSSSTRIPIRVAYQGEPGAYSEKATRELLGKNVVAVGRPNFESCFKAVEGMECDYACLPVENSLGGSIHENYDLMLRYDLTIVAEHEFRVHHCLLAKPGVKKEDIKYAISHPQALAQCDNYLRGLDITPVPSYDTAGSAKLLAEGKKLPRDCTPENTASIASDLAGKTYGLNCLAEGIEDDDSNFTRFLLLGRKGVVQYLTSQIPAKASRMSCELLCDMYFVPLVSSYLTYAMCLLYLFRAHRHVSLLYL